MKLQLAFHLRKQRFFQSSSFKNNKEYRQDIQTLQIIMNSKIAIVYLCHFARRKFTSSFTKCQNECSWSLLPCSGVYRNTSSPYLMLEFQELFMQYALHQLVKGSFLKSFQTDIQCSLFRNAAFTEAVVKII